MFLTFPKIIAWLLAYKYALLFPIAVLEGPIITVIGAFLASMGVMNVYLVFITVLVGDLVGDALYYWLGRSGGGRLLTKFGKHMGITPEKIQYIEYYFGKNTKKTIIIGKLTHAFGMVVLLTAGILRVEFWEFLWANFLGSVPKSFVLVLLGYYFGKAYEQINTYINQGIIIIVVIVVLFTAGYFAVNKLSKNYFKK